MKELIEKYLKLSIKLDHTEINHFDGIRWISTTKVYSDPRGIFPLNTVKFEKYINLTKEEYDRTEPEGSFIYDCYSVVYQKLKPEYESRKYTTSVRHTLYLAFYPL